MEINSKGRLARREVMRTYDRTWGEIEDMLEDAKARRAQWAQFYEHAKRNSDKESMKDAARNAKALEGVEKTLRWVLGESGIRDPLN
jgi:hypothetical protein